MRDGYESLVGGKMSNIRISCQVKSKIRYLDAGIEAVSIRNIDVSYDWSINFNFCSLGIPWGIITEFNLQRTPSCRSLLTWIPGSCHRVRAILLSSRRGSHMSIGIVKGRDIGIGVVRFRDM